MIGMGLSTLVVAVILLALVRTGQISHERLTKSRALVFVMTLITGAAITPDYFSCFIMTVPVQIGLQICIWISAGWERQKRRKELEREKAGS